MAILTTPNAGLPYPDDNEYLKDVPDHIRVLAQALDKHKVPNYATVSERAAKIPSPQVGQLAWVVTLLPDGRGGLTIYTGTNSQWQRIWPTSPLLSSGSAAPTGVSEAGAIYVQI